MSIAEKLKKIDQNLSGAISSGKVKLVNVIKYATDEQVIEAYNLGQRIFGENYVLPALKRREQLKEHFPNPEEIEWHLIGELQKNKVNKVVGNFQLIHSVGSRELAEKINARAEQLNIKQKVLLQINMTGDKNGFSPEEYKSSLEGLLELTAIDIRGLMVMAPHNPSERSETIFKEMRQFLRVLESCHSCGGPFELSMGMSNDYALAVGHGATIIRIGSAIFGDS